MAPLTAIKLTCEYRENPLGVNALPRFGWQLAGEGCQSGYRIAVALTPAEARRGKGIWNSGCVRGEQSQGTYAGMPLQSATRYYFSVQVTGGEGASAYSEPAWFETGLLEEKLWEGCWLGMPVHTPGGAPVQYFRRVFTLAKPVAKARAYVAGIGYFELYANGEKQGKNVLDPPLTGYASRVLYTVFDVTAALHQGDNCLGVAVACGWVTQPCFILQCNGEYTDGTPFSLYTKPLEWDMTFGPITKTDIYRGEQYDYRYQIEGWCQPDPSFLQRLPLKGWEVYASFLPWPGTNRDDSYADVENKRYRAMQVPAPGGRLAAANLEPIQVVGELPAKSITQPKPGVFVVDFGQNMAGWARFTLQTEIPRTVVVRYSELLHEDGTLNQDHLKAAEIAHAPEPMQTDVFYIGPGEREYETHFTYHGFRYVQVEGVTGLQPSGIFARVVRSAVSQTGFLETGNPLINQIQQNILWGEGSNLYSIPTDCPQRDERMGWLNDLSARAEESVFNYNMSLFFEKWVQDIRDAQDACGAIPDTAPKKRGNQPADPVCVSYLLCAKLCWLHYGNTRVIADNYAGFVNWADYLFRHAENNLLTYSYWGDWAAPWDATIPSICHAVSAITPGEFVSSCYLYYHYRLLTEFARLLHKEEDLPLFEARARAVKKAICHEWLNPETGSFATGSQGCNALALYLELSPEHAPLTAQRLNEDVLANGCHLTTGNQCTKYLLEMLAYHGYGETAFALATQTTYPSWGFMVENGATTIWERWENATGKGMNSHNHPMFASVSAYYYKYLAGIAPSEQGPGFLRFTVEPPVLSQLTRAEARLQTVRGELASLWRREGGLFTLELTVPAGSTAVVRLPCQPGQKVLVNGALLYGPGQTEREGLTLLGLQGGRLSVQAQGGGYTFTVGD